MLIRFFLFARNFVRREFYQPFDQPSSSAPFPVYIFFILPLVYASSLSRDISARRNTYRDLAVGNDSSPLLNNAPRATATTSFDGFVSTSTAALRCFRLRVCVSSASSVSSLISNDVTSNDDCLDLPPSSLPNLAILERSLSPLLVCSSQPGFERSREKGHAMLRIPFARRDRGTR